MMQIKFRLTGVAPEQSLRLVEVDPEQTIAEIKRSVAIAYKLNPILAIQFIYRAKVLPDNLKFSKIGIQPKTDLITVMATQAGGEQITKEQILSHIFSFCKKICRSSHRENIEKAVLDQHAKTHFTSLKQIEQYILDYLDITLTGIDRLVPDLFYSEE